MIRKARPEEAAPEERVTTYGITKQFDRYQRIQDAPNSFYVSFGTSRARIAERIMEDNMILDGKKVLHVFDESTWFSTAGFSDDENTGELLKKLIECGQQSTIAFQV